MVYNMYFPKVHEYEVKHNNDRIDETVKFLPLCMDLQSI